VRKDGANVALVSLKEMVEHAWKNGYAVGYFESWNLESTLAVIDAAEKTRSPVIIGFNGGFLANRERQVAENIFHYGAMGKAIACRARVPVALLLNECEDFATVVQGIVAGFNGVMYSGEELSFEDQEALVKHIVDIAHPCGVYVEGEVGHLPTAERGRGVLHLGELSDPERAARFVRETGVDALSISVGNIHLLENEKAHLNHDLIDALCKAAQVPLVLHGGTGIDKDDIRGAIERGVSKINVGTALKRMFLDSLTDALNEPDTGYGNVHELLGKGGARDILSRARARLAEEVIRFMELFQSAGKGNQM
jgi:ketose-bisphosphate aldolase